MNFIPVDKAACDMVQKQILEDNLYVAEILAKIKQEDPNIYEIIKEMSRLGETDQDQRWILLSGLTVYAVLHKQAEMDAKLTTVH